MRYAAAVALAGLLLAGCGDDGSQRLDSQQPDVQPTHTGSECSAGWTAYPGPPECSRSATSVPSPEPTQTRAPAPGETSAPPGKPTARPEPSRSAARSSTPLASATAGRGSASPAATVRPTPAPSRSPSPRPTGQLVITEADSGKTFTISRSTADALLRLGDGWLWSQPERDGTSVELYQRQFIQDPGYSEWEIRPVSSGTTVLRSSGSLPCHQAEPPCAAPNRVFEVTVVVR